MGEYLREINPSMKDLSISALVAADPVSVSRFMENKRKAFIDFIMSSDNPIGKVTHYFCRLEYQGCGLQHFHFAIWVEGAPILGDEESAKDIQKRLSGLSQNMCLARFPTRCYLQFYMIK